ncbi:16S rRNA (guanine(527)-N(7))-methyltransferase RsmG [Nautilia sp.]
MENEKFGIFTDELLKWNRVHKLTNYKTKEEIKEQIKDSLYPLKKIKNVKSAIDIGTGAGFPGLVLAVAMPETEWYLVEPLKKRYSFLNYIKIKLKLHNVKIVPSRLENANINPVELITTRAVMPSEEIIKIAKPYLQKNGKILLYKGSNVFDEIKNLKIKTEIFSKGSRNYLLIKDLYG